MNRQEYNDCVARGMKGKKLTREERGMEFCIVAKLCAGKSKDRSEAQHICSLPKEPKAPKAIGDFDQNAIYFKAGRKTAKLSPKEYIRICPCSLKRDGKNRN